ncbi:MAG: Undecaprenyl-diphosphatase [Parcubacteria bacterium OLB19]|nr:MAG: Undecaprenyl-diphosphatase [Parcubacteria bacterium OLB19]
MDILSAVILGLTEGVMGFLPLSSSGHIVLVNEIVPLAEANNIAISAIFYLTSALAVIIYFWSDIWVLLQTLMRKMGRLPVNEKDLVLLYSLLVGAIPALILGLILGTIIDKYLSSILVVAIAMMLSAIFFMYAEWRYYLSPPQGEITVNKGFKIGLFQLLSIIPGFSRLGMTMAGGMLLGLSRYESARFSFLLSIPIVIGFGLKKLLDLIVVGGEVMWLPVIISAVISLTLSLMVIHIFLLFVRRYTLWPFVWYSFILSALTFYYIFFVQ